MKDEIKKERIEIYEIDGKKYTVVSNQLPQDGIQTLSSSCVYVDY